MKKNEQSNFVTCNSCGKMIRVQSLCNSCVNMPREPETEESLDDFIKDIIQFIK